LVTTGRFIAFRPGRVLLTVVVAIAVATALTAKNALPNPYLQNGVRTKAACPRLTDAGAFARLSTRTTGLESVAACAGRS
jgi:hypothetical protein